MSRIVMKFGGTSVATVERIRQAARHVKREADAGNEVTVVVSAMSGKTNELVGWVNESSPLHDAREYDAVVASGEQVTAGLMAIVLAEMGIQSRSFQGWQVPIHTDDAHGAARITDIDPTTLDKRMKDGWVPVVTGFQGIAHSSRRSASARAGMRVRVYLAEVGVGELGVDLRRGDVGVAEQLLDVDDARAAAQHVGGE